MVVEHAGLSDVAVAEISRAVAAHVEPYYLLCVKENSQYVKIDVEEPGWHQTYAEWMRGRMQWYLVRKSDESVVFGIEVYDGEQPYYAKRHFAELGTETVEGYAHGIGKKCLDGHTDRLWILPRSEERDGYLITVGDDVDTLWKG